MKSLGIITTLFSLLLVIPLFGAGWSSSGEDIYQKRCSSCHDSADPETPVIHGQLSLYLERSLAAYARQMRYHIDMENIARSLDFHQVRELTRYLSSQKFCSVSVEVDAIGGDIAAGSQVTQIEGCRNCHGRKFQGMAGPRLAGQKTRYLIQAMRGYQDGSRRGHAPMETIMAQYSDRDIRNVAAYLNALRPATCP